MPIDLTIFNALSLLLPPINVVFQDPATQQINERKIINNVFDPKIYDAAMPSNPPAKVKPYFSIHHVENLNEDQQLMILHGVIALMWEDSRISWKPSDYGYVSEITRKRSQLDGRIWLPKVYLTEIFFRTANILKFETTQVTFRSSGEVLCEIHVLVKTSCYFEYDDYPYDSQNCSFTMYSPFTIDRMIFVKNQDRQIWYRERIGQSNLNVTKVDVGDFVLENVESKNVYLVAGSKVVDSVDKIPSRMVRSVFWYNLVFRRHNIYYVTRMAVPLFTISCLTYAFCLLRSQHGFIWLVLCLAVQVMNAAILMDNLPPDYTKMPTIGLIATLVLFETICLIMWRFTTIYIVQNFRDRQDIRSKFDLVDNFLSVYFVIRVIHIYMKLF
ncbi:unnamed protein product [Nippostrongylus brasiliensis]|uniref:Neur_chan_LBD domain-containing protein n=1 Tax=Nippostrongylus brasiliensis TaxID=27835 RepID=A0A0N4XV45_NIPBR|nr:hypothetical protein Q1695_001120 [Nippostrongylus brasiliensis]VDL70228.1 unnamed protein product [Nippostrongylus brasiliensis]